MQEIIDQITNDIKALIFDLDGTLADTLPLHYGAWEYAGETLGFHVTKEMIIAHSGTPTVKVAEILGAKFNWNIDPEIIARKKSERYYELKKMHGKIQAITPILDIAKRFHGRLPLGVGTGSTRSGALQSLNDIQATKLFDIIVTASDVKNPKPHPETFMKSAEHFGLRPEQCLVFEDGAAGIQAVKTAGMKLIDVKDYL